MDRSCYVCSANADTRPYGPKGEYICFGCAMGDPKRKHDAEDMLGKLLSHQGDMILTLDGPVPLDKSSMN